MPAVSSWVLSIRQQVRRLDLRDRDVVNRRTLFSSLVAPGSFFLSFIRVRNLTHVYTPRVGPSLEALRGVDLEIDAGEYLAVVGANGSGKTTLACHLNALLLPTAGDVWVDGRNTREPAHMRAIRSTVGMVFQSPADQLVATMVQEDVAFGPENLGVPQPQLSQQVREALQRVQMWHARQRPPHLLSAGQQQRVAIAGVLAMRPRCLILDEATAMLDPQGRRDVLNIVEQLHRSGLMVITITHMMEEALRARRIVVMHRGRVAMDGTPQEVFASSHLAEWGLTLPPAAELARRLRARSPSFPGGVLTADQLAQAVTEVLR